MDTSVDEFSSVLEDFESDRKASRKSAGPDAALKDSPDTSETLEYLRGWTLKQDQITKQMADHQKLVETMMQALLQKDVGDAPCVPPPPRFDAFCDPKPPPELAQARLASPRDADVLPDFNDDEAVKPLESEVLESADLLPGVVAARNSIGLERGITIESDNWSEHSMGRLHSVFVDAIWHVSGAEEKDHRTWHMEAIESIVENPKFEYFAAIFIFLHSIFIGVSVEYLATVSSEKHPLLAIGNVLFVGVFCVEVGVKVVAERQEFCLGHEWKWNLFDILLIATVFAEVLMSVVFQQKSMKTVLKIAEMVRTIRILRIFRMLKFSLTLRMVVAKILSSFRSLLWILILFALMVYVVAVCLTQGCNDFLAGEQHLVGSDNLIGTKKAMFNYFGSIPRSCFTLFASISGGLVWAEVANVLGEVGGFYASMFVFFQALSLIAVMNLITGIFVGNAINSDSDLAREEEERVSVQQSEYLRKVFTRLDGDASDSISIDEFLNFARNPDLEVHLKSLNIDASEAETLFQLLDNDSSGTITITEFLQGCMELRGPTRNMDMKVLLYENKRIRHKLARHVRDMQRFASWTKEAIGSVSTVS